VTIMDPLGWIAETLRLRPKVESSADIEAPPAEEPDEEPVAAAADVPQGVWGEEGVTGLKTAGGRIRREYNADLATMSDRVERFDEMRKSDTACASLEGLLSLPIREADWWIEPGDFPDEADMIARNLGTDGYSGTMTMAWDDLLREALLSPLYGFGVHEKVFEEQDGGWLGWRKFAERDRRTIGRWLFDETGGLAGLVQRGYSPGESTYKTVEFDSMDKLIVWTWRREAGDPEGLGMLRQAYKAFRYKEAFEEFAAIRIERQACGIPTAVGPEQGYSDETMNEILDLLGRLRTGEQTGLVAPAGWVFDMLTLGPADVPFESHLEREHQYILQSGAAGFVGLGQGGDTGAWALSRDLSSIFMLMLNAVADWLCNYFNRYAISQIMRYNAVSLGDGDLPRLQHGSVAVRDPRVFAEALKIIFDPNLEIPEDVEATFRQMMGLKVKSRLDMQESAEGTEKEGPTPEITRIEDVDEGVSEDE